MSSSSDSSRGGHPPRGGAGRPPAGAREPAKRCPLCPHLNMHHTSSGKCALCPCSGKSLLQQMAEADAP